jgi:hypothetical protein
VGLQAISQLVSRAFSLYCTLEAVHSFATLLDHSKYNCLTSSALSSANKFMTLGFGAKFVCRFLSVHQFLTTSEACQVIFLRANIAASKKVRFECERPKGLPCSMRSVLLNELWWACVHASGRKWVGGWFGVSFFFFPLWRFGKKKKPLASEGEEKTRKHCEAHMLSGQ